MENLNKPLSEYQIYICDMDGTLYRQTPVRIRMAIQLVLYYFLHIAKLKELFVLRAYRKLRNGDSLIDAEDFENILFTALSRRYSMDESRIRAFIGRWIDKEPLKYICRYRNAELIEFLQTQKQNGKVVVVYSDHPAADKLKAVGFDVDYYFCANDEHIKCLKPNSKGLEYITGFLGGDIDNMVFIGDRYEKDGLCSQKIGMDFKII